MIKESKETVTLGFIGSLLRDRFLSALAKHRDDLDWSALALGASEDAGLTPLVLTEKFGGALLAAPGGV